MDGNVKKRLCYDAGGQPLLKTPEHLSCNATRDILYVSDSTENCVIAIDNTGNIVYKFTHTEIKSPKALSCDDEGNVYVACNNKVVLIDSHGKKCRVLIESSSKDITGIYYNIAAQQLVVIDGVRNVTFFSVK
jgi:DNA-binding beta-propeller fold protein YncE